MKFRILMACAAAAGLLAACGASEDADQAQIEGNAVDTAADNSAAEQQVAEAAPMAPPTGPELMPAPAPTVQEVAPEDGERVAEAIVGGMTSVADALDAVTDEATAEAAAQAIRVANTNLIDAVNATGVTPNDPGMAPYMEQHMDALIAAEQKMREAGERLQADHPELMEIISAASNQTTADQPGAAAPQ